MKIENTYNCERCLNKKVCKYYEKCKNYSNKDLFIKSKGKNDFVTENLRISINCEHYRTEANTIVYTGDYQYMQPSDGTNIKGFEPHFDPNSSTGSPLSKNRDITICNATDKSTNLEKLYVNLENNGSESSKNLSRIITSKKHI